MTKILGVDVGSLAVKAAAYDPLQQQVEEVEVVLHQRQPLRKTIKLLVKWMEDQKISRIAFTGVMGKELAEYLDCYYVNSPLASAKANLKLYPHLRTILNIGASSSNLILIKENKKGEPELEDIVLPPHCSAGTGSFLDQSASRFGCSIQEFSQLALQSKNPENISGTCAVFAGSDMIDKQQKGARKDDLAGGLHYALVRYLIGTLGKGKKLQPPYSFQGGVAENKGMIKALEDVLSVEMNNREIFIPPFFRSMSALGAAILASKEHFGQERDKRFFLQERLQQATEKINRIYVSHDNHLPPLKLNDKIIIRKGAIDKAPSSKEKIPVFIGIDVGSVSTCLAVLYYPPQSLLQDWKLIAKKYLPTRSSPLDAVSLGLKEIQEEIGHRIYVRDVAVTGSGRKFIADYLGGVRDVNEITAHRTGSQTVANRLKISFDEIFEIGGQDSKYMKGIEQFDMNKSCAAGTGSFLEEQAKHLGVKIEEFSSLALQARTPVSFGNKKCTVFIEEELSARQGKMDRRDLLASAVYGVAENFLSQFKIGDKKGKTIFFQGGVALNPAVAAALHYFTRAKIIVPEHNEVMGAIGAAVYARKNYPNCTKFIGLEKAGKRSYSVDSFQCEGCANFCNVSKVTTSDRVTLYGGDRCEKYSLSTGQRETISSPIPDLFKERERLLRQDHMDSVRKSTERFPRVGIPRLFSQYYEFFPLWKGFFEALGFEVVTSGRTNKKIISQGLDNVVAETCFPAEIAYGHLKDLLEKGVDYIFFPSLIDAPQTKWKERKTHFCTLSQNMPYAAPSTSPQLLAAEEKMLRPALRFHGKFYNLDQEMIRVGKKLGKKKKQSQEALKRGLDAWRKFKFKLKERGKEIFGQIEQWGIPVVIVGRDYTVGDPGINVDLPRMVIKAGGFPIPLDYLPLEEVDIKGIQDLANWKFYHRVMRAARIIKSHPQFHSIFFSVFSCGPDSFLEEFFKESLSGEPFLGIEVGKTTAPAHIQTRVEALMDSIRDQKKEVYSNSPVKFTVHMPSRRRVLYVPNMDQDFSVFREAMKILGVEVRALPPSTPGSLSLANRYIPEKTCLPARMTAGDYLEFLLHNSFHPQKIAFFNHQADGACRQKVYYLLQQIVFQRLGYKNIPIITPTPGKTAGYIEQMELINGGKKLTKTELAKFFYRFWKSIVANEAVRQLVLSRRPYEKRKGSLDEAYRKALKEFCPFIVQGDIQKAAFDFIEKIKQVPVDNNRGKVNIGIVGEGYVRVHQPSNQYCIRHLEELGAVTVLPMATSFLNFAMEYVSHQNGSLMLRFINFIQHYLEKRITNYVHPFLVFPEPKAKAIIKEAHKFMSPRAVSEAVEGIGLASLYAESKRIDGILNLIPAHCMAGSALQCYLERLHRDKGIPVLTIPLDGIYDKNFRANLELLVYKANLYRYSLKRS